MQNSGLASDGPPHCSLLLRSLVPSLPHPHGVSCVVVLSRTQALCLGWLPSIPSPNPGAASQALPSAALEAGLTAVSQGCSPLPPHGE